jgi:hypothetical protein
VTPDGRTNGFQEVEQAAFCAVIGSAGTQFQLCHRADRLFSRRTPSSILALVNPTLPSWCRLLNHSM